ncbi:uncharacterized protein LOC141914816 isoform X2 [Tubulanus polymorphus]|uniref:uncharacterized protein LOC141914816 isoform X2 n=1 Tax=Tubulanus polymorphus TaxID=672921 RepID=UPI003DA56B01
MKYYSFPFSRVIKQHIAVMVKLFIGLIPQFSIMLAFIVVKTATATTTASSRPLLVDPMTANKFFIIKNFSVKVTQAWIIDYTDPQSLEYHSLTHKRRDMLRQCFKASSGFYRVVLNEVRKAQSKSSHSESVLLTFDVEYELAVLVDSQRSEVGFDLKRQLETHVLGKLTDLSTVAAHKLNSTYDTYAFKDILKTQFEPCKIEGVCPTGYACRNDVDKFNISCEDKCQTSKCVHGQGECALFLNGTRYCRCFKNEQVHFFGEACNERLVDGADNKAVILGSSLGAALLLALMTLLIVVLCRRKRHREKDKNEVQWTETGSIAETYQSSLHIPRPKYSPEPVRTVTSISDNLEVASITT